MNNFLGLPSIPMNTGGSGAYPTYQKTSNLRSPALTFVFVDEREDSINDGTFFTAVDDAGYLTDIPASYHAGASGFAFADGHSEIHKWAPGWITQPVGLTPINGHNVTGTAEAADATWLDVHAVGVSAP